MQINLNNVQPHSIALGQNSLDFIAQQNMSFFKANPIRIGVFSGNFPFSIDGDHRIYTFSQIRKEQYPSILVLDMLTENGLSDFSTYLHDRFLETLDSRYSGKHKENIPKRDKIRLESIMKTIKFIQAQGVHRPADLATKIYETKAETDAAYDLQFAAFYRLSYGR